MIKGSLGVAVGYQDEEPVSSASTFRTCCKKSIGSFEAGVAKPVFFESYTNPQIFFVSWEDGLALMIVNTTEASLLEIEGFTCSQ